MRACLVQWARRESKAMGIKFHCPNGHKLNVKSFLAGKKGVCPKCGTKLRIPTASEPGLGADDDADDSDAGKLSPGLAGNGAAALAGVATSPTAQPKPSPSPLPAPIHVGAAQPAMAPVPGAFPAGPAGPLPNQALPPTPGDPIAEAPMARWYVRPPSGGQFGPAVGDIMRKWIAEGRVSSDSLVWREGWTDWQNAGKMFPHLQTAAAPAAP